MSSNTGSKIKFSLFGESHGVAIGGVIDGLPAGFEIDLEYIEKEMARRKPGQDPYSTKRSEDDQVEILSGYFNGKTTGTPLAFIIRNKDNRSKDYSSLKNLARPGHADYTGLIRYDGYNDYRGGGHFSGRITAPLVFYGAIAKQYVFENYGIRIFSKIDRIGEVEDAKMDYLDMDPDKFLQVIRDKKIPVLNQDAGEAMKKEIEAARLDQDSVGGIIECVGLNVPPGLGNPFFDSLESSIARLIFSVPATKGLEFGTGFDLTRMRGSKANDVMYYDDNMRMKTRTNNNGGILGGITNGMPVVFRVGIKPTPSISREQETIDMDKKENAKLEITGRHDPCIVPRALPVIESCLAISLMELLVV
ncbi:chorismate synthase [Alkalibacter mobilis]|uniref:chorismate synthase n=1 Tax=Alkalibacter mobilis TaxID=2787712 RepID=UPI00189E7406|nr:chorismate synthase [Alkalibacter mobilis]MBF7096434.1 chorismate synthase [Alkalibacter mobilis]